MLYIYIYIYIYIYNFLCGKKYDKIHRVKANVF